MKYTVKMKNPRTGEVETYNTEADRPEKLDSLDFFRGLGYEILSVEAKGGRAWRGSLNTNSR